VERGIAEVVYLSELVFFLCSIRNLVMKFDLETFEKLTPQCLGKVFYQVEVESTNDEARNDISSGRGESGRLYIAEFQTKGRGRGGNSWVCPAGQGLLFSLILEPDVAPALWYRMSLAVGISIVDVLLELGIEVTLKWPNDLYFEDRKLGGILIENVGGFLIVGVGLNVNVREFPEDLAMKAASLNQVSKQQLNREVLLSEMVRSIYKYGSLIGLGFEHVRERVIEYFYLKNKRVSMLVNGKIQEGNVMGLSENGYLMIENEGKSDEICQASAIKIIRLS
jgi:BirA family transcriptional regulator, biotin operon repressor / biotin---[acetyl-CoA-carboxylase] ligase